MLFFSKYSGLGNNFIFVDNREKKFPVDQVFIQNLCDRHEGIGADGVVLVENSDQADCRMLIFNADGSEAEMCGNALRCLYLFLEEFGNIKKTYSVQTFNRLLEITRNGDEIACQMGEVSSIDWDIELNFNQIPLKGHSLDTGVPHVVIPVNDLYRLPVLPLGSFVRHHKRFAPKGTNVDFISLNKDKVIEIRTYERGVENETQACGTGCAAAAIIGHILYGLTFPIRVKTLKGHILSFTFEYFEPKVKNVEMTGAARLIFKGELPLPERFKSFI